MADQIVERLITQLVFEGDLKQYERATGLVSGLSGAVFAMNAAFAGTAASVAQELTVMSRLGEGLGIGTQAAREMSQVFIALGSDMNDVSDALQTIADYGLEAAYGNEEWIKTFRHAGVEFQRFRNANPVEILEITADGIAGLENASERAAAASRLFGDDVGRKLLPLLVRGSKGLRDMREEARVFGGVVTEEAAEAAVILTTDMRRLRYVVDGTRTRLGIALIPVLQEVTGGMLDWVTANREWLDQKIGHAVDALTHTFEALTKPLGFVLTGLGAMYATARVAVAIQSLTTALNMTTGLGFALGPLVGPAGLLILGYLAVEDLMYAAEGAPSVFGDWAKSMGAESEFRIALVGTWDMLKEIVGLIGDISSAVDQTFNSKANLFNAFHDPETGQSLPWNWLQGKGFQVVGDEQPPPWLQGKGFQVVGDEQPPPTTLKTVLAGEGGDGGYNRGVQAVTDWLRGFRSSVADPGGADFTQAGRAVYNMAPTSADIARMDESAANERYMSSRQGMLTIGTININADGLSREEAQTLVNESLRREVTAAYDDADQGER